MASTTWIAAAASAAWALAAAPAAMAQTAAAASAADRHVDVRAVVPGIPPREASAPSDGSPKLTRDQRKDDALQARKAGALKPAGDGADFKDDAATRTAATARPASSVASVTPAATMTPSSAAPATAPRSSPTTVADAHATSAAALPGSQGRAATKKKAKKRPAAATS